MCISFCFCVASIAYCTNMIERIPDGISVVYVNDQMIYDSRPSPFESTTTIKTITNLEKIPTLVELNTVNTDTTTTPQTKNVTLKKHALNKDTDITMDTHLTTVHSVITSSISSDELKQESMSINNSTQPNIQTSTKNRNINFLSRTRVAVISSLCTIIFTVGVGFALYKLNRRRRHARYDFAAVEMTSF